MPSLVASGNRVLTPDLPGHGTLRGTLNHISFKQYVAAIIALINKQSNPVILVGHSMAGLVISQIAEEIPEKIKQLIYVAAYIPQDNDSLFGLAAQGQSRNLSPHLIIDKEKMEIRLNPSPELFSLFYHLCNEENVAFASTHLQEQPLEPFTAQVHVTKDRFGSVPKKAILCREDRALLVCDQLQMSQAVTANIVYLDADHSPFYSAVDQLVESLKIDN